MSRINEALGRAAEERRRDGTDGEEPTHVFPEGQDVQALTHEPFPVELAERRKARSHASFETPREAADSAQHSASDPAGSPTDAGASTPGDRGRILFERVDERLAEKLVIDGNMAPTSREQYRRLAAVLHDAQGHAGMCVVMVASAVPGEGKSLTAANVALTLSESYRRRVLLIDADLRKPALQQMFRLDTTVGLIDGLESRGDGRLVVRQVSTSLWVLPAGRPTADPMAGLTSDKMRDLVNDAREAFDWVIIDTPPLMLLPDAHLLSPLVDGAILVVKANSTPHELVRRAADIIGRKRITGVVLNQAEAALQAGYGGYAYGGEYYLSAGTDVERT